MAYNSQINIKDFIEDFGISNSSGFINANKNFTFSDFISNSNYKFRTSFLDNYQHIEKNIILYFKSGLFITSTHVYSLIITLDIGFFGNKTETAYTMDVIELNEFIYYFKFERINESGGRFKLWLSYNTFFYINNLDKLEEVNLIMKFRNSLNEFINLEGKRLTENKLKNEIEKKQKLNLSIKSVLGKLDKDNNGEVDLIDGDNFNKLLIKNQKVIIEIDKNYIQKFVKISNYINTKKNNTQKLFNKLIRIKSENDLNELVNLLKNQIHTYELLVFHSINMITSLVESDLITFYEIYECFDQLGVFNSNWENEVSNKLTDIGDGIKDLMYSIYQMENKIVSSIDNLTYVTQDSFKDLSFSVEKQLSSIDSTIKFNNLLTGIQIYQMYKINKNTKRIN